MTEHVSLEAALAAHLAPPAWATFFEVGDKTGFGQSRRADAVAMSTWPSRGLHMHGFEMKRSRGDWVRERDDPAKSATIQRFCDFWWLVVDDANFVKPGELPPTWGMLALERGKLVQKKAAPKLESEPWPRGFIAALLRAATKGMVRESVVAEMAEARAKEMTERHKEYAVRDHEQVARMHQELNDRVRKFEQASGLNLRTPDHVWPRQLQNPELVGQAVRHLLTHGLDYDGLLGVSNTLKVVQEQLDDAMKLAKQLPKVTGAPEDG